MTLQVALYFLKYMDKITDIFVFTLKNNEIEGKKIKYKRANYQITLNDCDNNHKIELFRIIRE